MLIAAFVGASSILMFVTLVWTLVIIGRRSILGAVLTLVLGFPVFYYLITGWGEEGKDIKLPFFLGFLPLVGVAVWLGMYYRDAVKEIEELKAATPAVQTAPLVPQAPAPTERERAREVRAAPPAAEAKLAAPEAKPAAAPRVPVQRAEAAKEAPRRQKAAASDCVYKPVMTDEDLAKCR